MKPFRAAAVLLASVLGAGNSQAAEVIIDGNTSDWNQQDRLELPPRTPVPGYELYGRFENDSYKVLLRSLNSSISTRTTLWLNTDQDSDTGHKIWGYAGGAEYNVNIAADGKPYLYTGADGQTLVSGPLKHSIVADGSGSNMELEIPASAIGSPDGSGINMLLDVNNSDFLPLSYWPHSNNYTIAKRTVFENGLISIDADKSDWNVGDRMDLAAENTVDGSELYGRYEDGKYKFLLHDQYRTIGTSTTFWLNTDQDSDTGHQIWGWAGGAEFNVNVSTDGKPYLYSGADGQNLVAGPLEYAIGPDGLSGSIMEFEIPEAMLGSPSGKGLNLLIDVNNNSYMPRSYWPASNNYVLNRDKGNAPIAIVYSKSTESNFFATKAYSQLFMSVQSQAMMAGLPYDMLNENDLLDLDKIKKYKTLVFPYFSNVKESLLPGIQQNLQTAVSQHNVGLVTAGNFLTNKATGDSLAGDAYSRMKSLMGVTRTDGAGPVSLSYKISDSTHPVTNNEYAYNEVLKSYTGAYTDYFVSTGAYPSKVLAQQVIDGSTTRDALIVTENGGRHAHFGTVQQMTDVNILWSVLQWSVYGEKAPAALSLTRNNSVFVSRNDMDQSMFIDEVAPVEVPLLTILQTWKRDYNFVGSYYINVGANAANQEQTDWSVSGPLYKDYMALSNEIGTHSYTHPHDTNILTPEQIRFEFRDSVSVIEQNLNLKNIGAAVPGAPEGLDTAEEIMKHVEYLSGGYSAAGAGYNNAFGFLTPASGKVYLSPNMSFDFTLVEFQRRTAAQAKQIWFNEFDDLLRHTPQGLVHWPWHDYGPVNFDNAGYTFDMFDSMIKKAAQHGSEFITGEDFAKRIKAFQSSGLSVSSNGSTVTAKVDSGDVGNFSLRMAPGKKIRSVANWYAWNDTQVFLPKSGGEYVIETGASPVNVSRITALPARGKLLKLSGDGTDIRFDFSGEGRVKVKLKCAPVNGFNVTGGTFRYQFIEGEGDVVEIIFPEDKQYPETFVDASC